MQIKVYRAEIPFHVHFLGFEPELLKNLTLSRLTVYLLSNNISKTLKTSNVLLRTCSKTKNLHHLPD